MIDQKVMFHAVVTNRKTFSKGVQSLSKVGWGDPEIGLKWDHLALPESILHQREFPTFVVSSPKVCSYVKSVEDHFMYTCLPQICSNLGKLKLGMLPDN